MSHTKSESQNTDFSSSVLLFTWSALGSMPLLFFGSIIAKHKALEGLSQASVEYQALQLVSSLEHYGVEWHWVRDAEGQRLAIGVGPDGIAICREDFSLVNRLGMAQSALDGVTVIKWRPAHIRISHATWNQFVPSLPFSNASSFPFNAGYLIP